MNRVDCPICKDKLYTVETEHPADREIACNGCSATWSEGKEPEDE